MGHGGAQSQTTETKLPPELQGWANKYLAALGNLVLPGGQIAQSPLPFHATAPMSPQQIQAGNMVSQETYGPQGAPQGQAPNTQQLMASVAGSPYWQAQLAQNPSLASAFSIPALSQIGQLFG